jgi:hypothetical protein
VGLMERAQSWLVTTLRGAAPAGTLLYVRAADEKPITLTGKAWVGQYRFRVADVSTGQTRLIWSDRDYLVPVADLALSDGTPVVPRRGDRFEETSAAGVREVYEVKPYADEPEWRYADPLRKMFRVHTKRVTPDAC